MKIAKATAADVQLDPGADFHTAGINVFYAADSRDEMGLISHGNAIECHGDGEAAASALRDRVLLCLTMHDELVAALKAVVSVADRKTDEFDMARAAIAKAEGR